MLAFVATVKVCFARAESGVKDPEAIAKEQVGLFDEEDPATEQVGLKLPLNPPEGV